MVKVVVSDLDGTLLNDVHTIGQYTNSVLSDIVNKGIHLGIATGRPWGDVVGLRELLGAKAFLITSNGARVHDEADRCVYSLDIPSELVEELIRIPPPGDAHLNIYVDHGWFVVRENPMILAEYTQSGYGYELVSHAALPRIGVSKLFWIGDHDVLADFKTLLIEKYGDRLSITFSAPNYLEVMAAGVSKGAALQVILAAKALDFKHVMAFGDGDNDKDMLARAGLGLLMGNASESLRLSLPDLETIGSHAEESVARYLAKHVLT